MNHSLRQRLGLSIAFISIAVWTTIALLQMTVIAREVNHLFDAHIADAAEILRTLIVSEMREHAAGDMEASQVEAAVFMELHQHLIKPLYATDHAYEIIFGNGHQSFRSRNAPTASMALSGVSGFQDRVINGREWRVYSVTSAPDPLQVTVAEPYQSREAVVRQFRNRILVPPVAGLLLLLVLVVRTIKWGLRPLDKIVALIDQRDPKQLSELPSATHVEIKPVVSAINGLLARLGRALAAEQRFTADAAHELRTPLAGIRTQAEVARNARRDDEREHALRQLIIGVERMTHLVDQLLTLARLEPAQITRQFVVVNLSMLLTKCVSNVASWDCSIVINIDDSIQLHGNPELLTIAINNVLLNAYLYSGPGCKINISAQAQNNGRIVLFIDDNGPGVPAPELSRVVRRFYRRAGTQGSGSGLGLAIVQQCAELHHAALELTASPLGGLRVAITFVDI